MADVKNFGLVGVGSTVQWAKGGSRIKTTGSAFNLRNAADSSDVALTAAGITSSSGNVTLTTGNLVATAGNLVATAGNLTLSANSGEISIGDAGTLVRQGTGVFQFTGTGATMVPVGSTAQQPTGATGMVRLNNDSTPVLEYFNGTVWTQVSGTSALQTEIDNIETSLGAAINSSGNYVSGGFSGPVIGTTASFTEAIQNIADYAEANDSLDEIFPSLANGNVIYSAAGVWTQAAPGATSGVQAYDAELTAIAGLAGTGFVVITGAGTAASRSITGSAGRITVANGDGVASSPTIDLNTLTDAGTGTFVKITRDAYGRVEGTTAVVASDITGLVDNTYVNVAGDTMDSAANLTFSGGGEVLGLPAVPTTDTAATSKAYVDSVAAGLTWKTAVKAATTTAGTLATDFEDGDTIDGVTLATNDRILIKNQAAPADNGIYIVQATGAPVRSTDADTPAELDSAAVFVQQGTVNADTGWTQTATIVTVGTTAQTWVQFSGANAYVGGVGIDITGNVISANLGAGIIELPSDEIGIDLFSASSGGIILTTDGTTRSTASAAALHLLLPAGSGLTQDSTGLYIPADGITNAMLLNDAITLDADSGTGTVALGGTLDIIGDATQGIVTSTSGSQVVITASNATSAQKGVASFDAGQFTVTAGAVSLQTVDVADGGTGATSLLDTAVLIGNGTGAVEATTALTFDTDTLRIGGTSGISIEGDGTDAILTVLATNGDLVLLPNGTGSVVVGPSGAGLIQSDVGTTLTVRGNNGLTLESGTAGQDITMLVPSGTTTKVTVSGASATDYATGLADADLVNKKYVDDAIATGAAAGAIKAVTATVDLSTTGVTNVGAVLPAGATILSVKVNVTAADTATGTLQVGKSGGSEYMTTSENDTQTTGLYMAETYVVEAGAVQVEATVAGTPGGAGSAQVIVTYKVAG